MCQTGAAVQCAVDGWRAVCMTMRPVGLGLGTLETHSVASGSVPLPGESRQPFGIRFAHENTPHLTKADPSNFVKSQTRARGPEPEPDMGQSFSPYPLCMCAGHATRDKLQTRTTTAHSNKHIKPKTQDCTPTSVLSLIVVKPYSDSTSRSRSQSTLYTIMFWSLPRRSGSTV